MGEQLLQEEAFRQKAGHYLVCFIEGCPLHHECLRWLVGQYTDTKLISQISINPLNPKMGREDCEMFRKNQRVVMKRGLTHLYDDMPARIEKRIRQLLIQFWGRKKYFETRKGERLITPEMQDDVVDACRHHGWAGPIVFDGEEEDWIW